MKIKQLDVAGFRSLKNASWQPGDLNVVIGQNGTGKSNLLRLLELISASAQTKLSKHIQAAGGMNAILWDGVATSINIDLKLSSPEHEYELELAQLGKTSSYVVQRELLTGSDSGKNGSEPSIIKHIERTDLQSDSVEELFGSLDYVPVEETILSFPFIAGTSNSTIHLLRNQLKRIAVYHDIDVSQNSKIRQAVVARNERQIEPDGQNLISVLHTLYTEDREFERNIDVSMRAAFGAEYEKLVFAPDAGDQRVQMRVRWRSLQRAQSTADLSDGTLRYLLLVTILAAPVPPSPPLLIAIDEPETGLHPTMLPIIAEYAMEASSRTQVVFTTHSPQFLDAFTDIKPTTTVAQWENGETSLQVLDGKVMDYWLAEYSLGSLFTSGELEALA